MPSIKQIWYPFEADSTVTSNSTHSLLTTYYIFTYPMVLYKQLIIQNILFHLSLAKDITYMWLFWLNIAPKIKSELLIYVITKLCHLSLENWELWSLTMNHKSWKKFWHENGKVHYINDNVATFIISMLALHF